MHPLEGDNLLGVSENVALSSLTIPCGTGQMAGWLCLTSKICVYLQLQEQIN
jgi:hypothetical protein